MDAKNPYLCPVHNASNGSIAARNTPRGQALEFWSFPCEPDEQERLNRIAQTPDKNKNVYCWRRRRTCSNQSCQDPVTLAPHRFSKSERHLWNCPICGKDRHCRRLVTEPNRGCYQHGGKTPQGWALPQTKTGQYSSALRVTPLREEYERMLASEKLFSVDDAIALLQARLIEILKEYGGGASRALLKQMKENRQQYQRELRSSTPDAQVLRRLDLALDELLTKGSQAYEVMDDFKDVARSVSNLITNRDRHMEAERLMITSDKAWLMLAHIEETFRVGAEMLVDFVDESYIQRQCEWLGVDFTQLSEKRINELKQAYRDARQEEKRQFLAYASDRFKGMAEKGLGPCE